MLSIMWLSLGIFIFSILVMFFVMYLEKKGKIQANGYLIDNLWTIPLWIVGIAFIVFISITIHFYSRKNQIELINKKFGTEYTVKDAFWSGSIIQEMIEGEYHRVKIETEE